MPPLEEWPKANVYDQALLERSTTFKDPAIKTGDLLRDATGPIRLNGGGKYVCVYRVGDWVVRCFTEKPPPDMIERYKAITTYVNNNSSEMPFLVKQFWVEQGVRVDGRMLPFLKVPFLPGCDTLGAFLEQHHAERNVVNDIAKKFLDIINTLERKQVAHGDLDITNILIVGRYPSLSLKLIDYDGMYVPTLAPRSLPPADLGHIHFQHPEAGIRHFGPDMDRFSVLIIYLSLIAIAQEPALWDNCGANDTDRLLLGADDYKHLSESMNHSRLAAIQGNKIELRKCLNELRVSIREERMPRALKDVLSEPEMVQSQRLPIARRLPVDVNPSTPLPPLPPPEPVVPPSPALVPPPPPPPAKPGRAWLISVTAIVWIVVALLLLNMSSNGTSTSNNGNWVTILMLIFGWIVFLVVRHNRNKRKR